MAMNEEEFYRHLSAFMSDEEIEEIKEQSIINREQQIADARIFHDVFGTGRGPELLEVLRHKTTYLPAMNRSNALADEIDIPLNPSEFMAFREGQNSIVRFIERQIKLSQETI